MSFAIPRSRELGLSKKEKQSYSLLNALGHIQKGNWNELGLEREVSDVIANRLGKQPRGLYIPTEIGWSNCTKDYKFTMGMNDWGRN